MSSINKRQRTSSTLEDVTTSKDDTCSSEELLSKIGTISSSIQNVSNNDPKIEKLKNEAETIYNISLKEISKDNPNITRLARYLTDIQSKYEKIISSSNIIKPKTSSVVDRSSVKKISASSSDIPLQQPSPEPSKITEATTDQKKALLSTGKVLEEDIDKYGIVGDYTDDYYKDWYIKYDGKYNDEKLNFVAIYEAEYHKYYNDTYTPGQLAKTYNKIAESFIVKRCSYCDGKAIIEYLKFIQDNPQFALPTLLWIDTFHDFKEERLKKGKRNLNEVIDHLCHKIYGHHWGKLTTYIDDKKTKFQTVKDCVDIGHTYNFDKMYQNSFFTFDTITPNGDPKNINSNTSRGNEPKVTGFHKDVEHTVLRPLVIVKDDVFKSENYNTKEKVAQLLYKVSNVFINTTGGWEGDFLYAYLMYNFNFDMTKDGLIQNLRDVFWEQIKADKKEDYTIPYYAKDVDKGSSNFFKGTNVILPASLFDANRSNSSDVIGHFVPIDTTVIPLCNGYKFEYHYSQDKCNLTLKYTGNNQTYNLCNIPTDSFSNNSSCINTSMKKEDLQANYPTIDDFIKKLSAHKTTQNQPLKDIENSISKLLSSIPPNYKDLADDNILTEVKTSVSKVYFGGKDMSGCVKIPNGQGMSPIDVVSVVIGLLIKAKDNTKYRNSGHPLSPISCKELDFWVALKRIGDFGQIMQCKQLGIPLFTNDNMQLLISMASCSSAVWTGDNAKVLWYDSNNDAILCNGLNPNLGREICNKTRIGSNPVNITIKATLTILDQINNFEQYAQLRTDYDTQYKINKEKPEFGVFLETMLKNIKETIYKLQNITMPDDLKKYFHYRMQEQKLLLPIVLFKEVYRYNNGSEIQKYKKVLYSELEKLLNTLNIPENISKLDWKTVVEEYKTLRETLESEITSQTYSDTINEQLLFEGNNKDNFIQLDDKNNKLQETAKNIESKYVDKLAELNNIRGGCIVEVEMKEEEKKEE